MAVVELERVSKSFPKGFLGGKQPVLSDLSLCVETGEVFGLLGHNGAGKTTLMRIVLGLLRPDAGTVRLFDQRGATLDARRRIGFVGDEVGLYPSLCAEEMLRMAGRLFGIPREVLRTRTDELIETVGLTDARKRRIKKYSRGMRQRLAVAVALVNDPELLLLDEPYLGLDPIGRRRLRRLLLSLKQRGKTIIISSHIVPDVEAICDRVGILSDGHLRQTLPLRDIHAEKSTQAEITVSGVDARTFTGIHDSIEVVYGNEEAVVLRCGGTALIREVITKTYTFGGEVLEIKPLKFSLEDYLMESMGEASLGGETFSPAIEEMIHADTR